MIARINDKTEKALRAAIGDVVRLEEGAPLPSLDALNAQEREEALGLAVVITSYVLIEACGSQWPVRNSIQKIARTLATTSSNAERLHLDPEEIEAYLSRAVFGRERMEDVIADEPTFTRLPVIVAGEALAVYSKGYDSMWDYLDVIETGIEEASALEARVLPAAVMRAYMKAPRD